MMIHFSNLKLHADCPAMVRHSLDRKKVPTRPTIVGSVADAIVFQQRKVAVYPGPVRRGSEWELFKSAHSGEIVCIQSEYDDAAGAAAAVVADGEAQSLLIGCTTQAVLRWESHGLQRETGIEGERGGVDAFCAGDHRPGRVVDLKITHDVEPMALSVHAMRSLWHAQLADYREALRANGYLIDEAYLIAVRATEPHIVTCLRVPEDQLREGERLIAQWSATHLQCLALGEWPGYARGAVDMIVPEWAQRGPELIGLEDE